MKKTFFCVPSSSLLSSLPALFLQLLCMVHAPKYNWPLLLRLLLDVLQKKTNALIVQGKIEEKKLQRRSYHKDEEAISSKPCFKSSVISDAILASSSAIFLAYTIASFAVSLYMHTSLLLIVSSRFWCSLLF